MRVFNAHTDIFSALHYGHLEGKKHIFRDEFYPCFLKGGVKSAIFVLWTDEAHTSDYAGFINAMRQSLKDILQEEADVLNPVRSFADYQAGLQDPAKVNFILGMEGLAQIGEDLDLIDEYYEVDGLRHASLTWNEANALAMGPGLSGGLTRTGKQALKRIQDLGILFDVSHLNDDGFWDVMKLNQGPVFASHSNSRALCDHPRNLSDDMLKELKKQGGLVGLNAVKSFIHPQEDKQDTQHLVAQLDHLVDRMGLDQVCFGFDFFDYLPAEALGSMADEDELSTPPEINTECHIPGFLRALRAAGYSQADLAGLAYKNMEAFLEKHLK